VTETLVLAATVAVAPSAHTNASNPSPRVVAAGTVTVAALVTITPQWLSFTAQRRVGRHRARGALHAEHVVLVDDRLVEAARVARAHGGDPEHGPARRPG
jgi:hypothetical protein